MVFEGWGEVETEDVWVKKQLSYGMLLEMKFGDKYKAGVVCREI